jgi:hypothetical protein
MATILELIGKGELIKLDPALGPRELEQRCIYLSARTAEGLGEKLKNMNSELGIENSPAEQLDDLVYHFATGGELDYPRQFHEMIHRREGIWELKTPDVRLFGWFYKRDCFICTAVADANVIKHGPADLLSSRGTMYSGYCEDAWYRREQLDVDPPKFISGNKLSDVVSNFSCA